MDKLEVVLRGDEGLNTAEVLHATLDNGEPLLPAPTGEALAESIYGPINAKLDETEAARQAAITAAEIADINAAAAQGVVAAGATILAAVPAAEAARAGAEGAAAAAIGTLDQIASVYPTIGDWYELTLDPNNLPARGYKLDGTAWEARGGTLVQVQAPAVVSGKPTHGDLVVTGSLIAPGVPTEYPTIDDWRELTLDATGRPFAGIRNDGSMYRVQGGVLALVTASQLLAANVDAAVGTFGSLTVTGTVVAPGLTAEYPTIDSWRELTLDATGRFSWGMKLDGSVFRAQAGQIVAGSSSSAASATVVPVYSYDRGSGTALPTPSALDPVDYLIIINGQSWAQGSDNGVAGNATVTTAAQHAGAALMPSPGVRPAGAAFSAYADLREQYAGGSFESPHSGMADVIMTRLNARLGFKPRIIFASACLGGQAYWDARLDDPNRGLKRGSEIYAEAIRIVQTCRDISAAQGRRLVVLAQVVIHGEQDFGNGLSASLYGRALDQWHAHVNEDWRAVTGQRQPIRTYVTQVQRGYTAFGKPAQPALAQLEAQDRNTGIRCAGPVYQAPGGQPGDGNDGSHLLPPGYRMIGGQCGHFLVEDMLGAYEEPLRVMDSWWQSTTEARLRYSKPITVETTNALVNVTGITVGAETYDGIGADAGVKFTDGTGSPPTVTGVSVTGGDTLIVTLSGAPAGKNPRLTIAAHRVVSTGCGRERGARSAIRSTSAFNTDALLGVSQYHWACQEQVTLPTI